MIDIEEFKFDFDHSDLSAISLQADGIRNFLELEGVILDSYWNEISDEEYPVLFFSVGLSSSMKALCVVFSIDYDTLIIKTFQARLSNHDEFRKYFCLK
jgi:hypothetical protein